MRSMVHCEVLHQVRDAAARQSLVDQPHSEDKFSPHDARDRQKEHRHTINGGSLGYSIS
jgi:hypothetical protein